MSEPLKLCPYCGGHALIYRSEEGYLVRCGKCGNGTIWYHSPHYAVAAWNKRPDTKNSYRFYQNTDCEYFPCHKTADTENFSCLFCYCPLYHMAGCPGNPEILPNGIKNCTNCTLPHMSYDTIITTLKEVRNDE